MLKQITTSQIVEEKKDRRSGKGLTVALSRRVYRMLNSDTFYVESESTDNLYYFVRYNFSGLQWCSCPDNSNRGLKCKHQFAIEFAIMKGTLKDIDKLPTEAKRYGSTVSSVEAKSYRDDDYDF
jgi:hypothetical protein